MKTTTTAPSTVRHFWVVLGKDYTEQDNHAIPDSTEEFQIALSEGESLESYFAHWLETGWQIESHEPASIEPQNATETEEF